MASKRPVTENSTSARDRIVATAMELFNRQGVHYTGTERIIAESGVAKMTFYKHFPSKAKLITEYLKRRDKKWFALLNEYSSKISLEPKERILALFDALEVWFKEPDFYGCPFIRGLSDFDESDDAEINACVSNHFDGTSRLILTLLEDAKIKNPQKLVSPLMSLVAGATIVALATKTSAAARDNRSIAKILLDNAEVVVILKSK